MPEVLTTWLARLERWVRLHPVAGSPGHAQLAAELAHALTACGLAVERYAHPTGDLILARGAGPGPLLALYGHYDVEPGGRTELRVTEGRVFGRGVADNLGPLALRLSALERVERRVNLLWVIEPGEESGSHALAAWGQGRHLPPPALWLDETGYFDLDGTQRIMTMDREGPADDAVRRCIDMATTWGRATRLEHRRLRRVVPEAGFTVERLFQGAPYLALGPNDDFSDVHGAQESLPLDTHSLSLRQLAFLFEMAAGAPSR